jgi:hypothetical protein
MKRRTKKIMLAVVVVGAVAAGGAAFTADNTFSQPTLNVAGYQKETVSGATISNTHYVLSNDGTTIEEVDLDFSPAINGKTNSADGVADVVKIGFGASSGTPADVTTACDVADDGTKATCGPALGVGNNDTASGTLAVAVSHP